MKPLAVLFLIVFIISGCFCPAAEAGEGVVRKSPIAGSWYPGEKNRLQSLVQDLLDKAQLGDMKGTPCAIVSPHAGIQFSGQAAAYAYKILAGKGIKRVILLGPSHYTFFRGLATSESDAYETPLGTVSVDRNISDALKKHPLFQGPSEAEVPEHSLEMQLPFLQVVLGDFEMVPLVVGEMSKKDYEDAAAVLKKYVDDTTIIAVSSDFTHYGSRFGYVPFRDDVKENLKKLDGGAIDKIVEKDLDGYLKYLDETGATICGARPIGVMLKMLSGETRGKLLNYYTSGDLLNDYNDTVSYAAIVFMQ